jgi:hypothetical protein
LRRPDRKVAGSVRISEPSIIASALGEVMSHGGSIECLICDSSLSISGFWQLCRNVDESLLTVPADQLNVVGKKAGKERGPARATAMTWEPRSESARKVGTARGLRRNLPDLLQIAFMFPHDFFLLLLSDSANFPEKEFQILFKELLRIELP